MFNLVESSNSSISVTAARLAKCSAFSILLVMNFGGTLRSEEAKRVKLFVKETPIIVNGKKVMMAGIQQADGTLGYSPNKSDGFHVEVINQLPVPTSIH